MGSKLVRLGNFSFRYRGYMLPVAVILLFIPSARFTADPGVLHGRFVQVLDLVKQQGAEKIALLKKLVR